MITLEVLQAVADKYEIAIETEIVPNELQMGVCMAISYEVKKKHSLYLPMDGYSFYRNLTGGRKYIAPLYIHKQDINECLVPRLEWLRNIIERMENGEDLQNP